MRNKFYLATVFLVAIFLASCTQNYVALDYTNAKGEVPQLGNLIFRFNKLLVADSLSNIWDSTEYISFEPQIEGRSGSINIFSAKTFAASYYLQSKDQK